jgi:hypothetical protein
MLDPPPARGRGTPGGVDRHGRWGGVRPWIRVIGLAGGPGANGSMTPVWGNPTGETGRYLNMGIGGTFTGRGGTTADEIRTGYYLEIT